jgi:hypothetical protein
MELSITTWPSDSTVFFKENQLPKTFQVEISCGASGVVDPDP